MKKSLEPVRFLLTYSLLGLLLFVPFGALTEPVQGDEDASGGRITYDQRQSGKYNIHVSIKDVAIIEMDQNEIEDGSYNEEDYYYDESDLTVKPLPTRSTTPAATQNHTTASTTATITSQDIPSTSVPAFLLTTIHNHNYSTSYSPNLLADIAAATQAANDNDASTLINTSAEPATTTTPFITSIPFARRTATPNVVILDTSVTNEQNNPTSTHKPTVVPVKVVAGRTKEMPVVMEPVLHPRYRYTSTRKNPPILLQEQSMQHENSEEQSMANEDSKIFKFKVRTQKLAYPSPTTYHPGGQAPFYAAGAFARRCRSHQYRDVSGNCRHKRSSSILKKLFRMLVSMPFANEHGDQSNE